MLELLLVEVFFLKGILVEVYYCEILLSWPICSIEVFLRGDSAQHI
jgi:hypothetical protein